MKCLWRFPRCPAILKIGRQCFIRLGGCPMKRGLKCVAALCLLAPAITSARAADEEQIKLAIEKGVAALRRLQQRDPGQREGWWNYPGRNNTSGMTSLAALTLLECGVQPDDPAIQLA